MLADVHPGGKSITWTSTGQCSLFGRPAWKLWFLASVDATLTCPTDADTLTLQGNQNPFRDAVAAELGLMVQKQILKGLISSRHVYQRLLLSGYHRGDALTH